MLRVLAPLRFADHYVRVILPLIYVPFVIYKLSVVDFGRSYSALLDSNPYCKTSAAPNVA